MILKYHTNEVEDGDQRLTRNYFEIIMISNISYLSYDIMINESYITCAAYVKTGPIENQLKISNCNQQNTRVLKSCR